MSLRALLSRWFPSDKKQPVRRKIRPTFDVFEERACPALTVGVDGFDLAGMGNTPTTAVPLGHIASGGHLSYSQNNLSISSPTDQDWYKFSFTGNPGAADKITATFKHADGDIDMRLYVLNGDGTTSQVATSLSINDDELIDLAGEVPGAYVLRIYGNQEAMNDYGLSVQLHPTGAVAATASYPTLNPVSTNGEVSSLRPQLSWTPATNALTYQIWIDDLTTGASNLHPNALADIGKTTWTPPSDLVSGHAYRFWARAVAVGSQGPWSFARDFTVSMVQFDPVTGPINDLTPNIPWKGVEGTTKYELWLDNNTTGQSNISFGAHFVSDDGWNPIGQGLAAGNSYSLYVRALNASNQGTWSPALNFTIGTMTLARPQTALNTLMPVLPVQQVGSATGAVIQLDDLTTGQTNMFPNQAINGDTWSPPQNLVVGHTYRIWAKIFGPGNSGPGWWGPGTDFTINTTIFPKTAPQTTLRPVMSWSTLPGVTNYEVWLVDQAGGGNLTPGVIVAAANFAPSFDLVSGHTYDLWVRAQGGSWSAKESFQVARVTEIKGDKVGNDRFILFTPLALVTSYELHINDLTTGSSNILPNTIVNQPATVTTFSAQFQLPAALDTTHSYRLWIKAKNSTGQGEWSDPFDFQPGLFV